MDAKWWSDVFSLPVGLSKWAELAAIVIAAPWALITFRRSNRIKTAELILDLEEECKEHVKTLVALECSEDYDRDFKRALEKSLQTKPHYTEKQDDSIDKVEAMLRHLHTCYHVRRLGVANELDNTYRYYLKLCVSDRRPELRDYVKYFWPNIYFWAQAAVEPWPKRFLPVIKQLPDRVGIWWLGPKPLRTVKARRRVAKPQVSK